jgi:hypothetical protein
VQDVIQQNARENSDQNYDKEYSRLIVAFDDTNSKLEEVKKIISKRKTTAYKIKNMLHALKEQEHLITEFDEELWFALIEKVVVNKDKNLTFIFKNEKTL